MLAYRLRKPTWLRYNVHEEVNTKRSVNIIYFFSRTREFGDLEEALGWLWLSYGAGGHCRTYNGYPLMRGSRRVQQRGYDTLIVR